MNTCEYEIFSGNYKKSNNRTAMPEMICCGKPGNNYLLPNNEITKKYFKNKRQVCLCIAHSEFVFDAIKPVEKIITEKGFGLL